MSGFDAEWLALREPVDHASRDATVAAQVTAHFAGREALTIVDLGCGTGSNLRAMAPLLPARQHWHLVDGDTVLLAAARQRLAGWADEAREEGTQLHLIKDGRHITLSVEAVDLTRRALSFRDVGADLVTAAALFDLVSGEWLERLVGACAQDRVPLYGVLNYDGIAEWAPAHPLDARVVAAFNRHQRGDKGFGPALGPTSGDALMQLLAAAGFRRWAGDSPWRLAATEARLIEATTAGFAAAAAQIAPELRSELDAWARQQGKAERMIVGHTDIFAAP